MEALAPFVPLCEKLGRLAQGLGHGSVDRVQAEFRGRIAEHDTRLLGIAVLVGILPGHTEEQVNLVNAPALAEERGIDLAETEGRLGRTTSPSSSRCGSASRERSVEVAGTGVGPRNAAHLVSVWGEGFYMPFADHIVAFRYKDQPGMIGRVGTVFGEDGVNIVSAAVGAEAPADKAVMVLTTDAPVPARRRGRDRRDGRLLRRPRRRPLGTAEAPGLGSRRVRARCLTRQDVASTGGCCRIKRRNKPVMGAYLPPRSLAGRQPREWTDSRDYRGKSSTHRNGPPPPSPVVSGRRSGSGDARRCGATPGLRPWG